MHIPSVFSVLQEYIIGEQVGVDKANFLKRVKAFSAVQSEHLLKPQVVFFQQVISNIMFFFFVFRHIDVLCFKQAPSLGSSNCEKCDLEVLIKEISGNFAIVF